MVKREVFYLREAVLNDYRFVINDTYRSELCLLYPPHLIAIAAVYLTCVLHPSTRNSIQAQSISRPVQGTPPTAGNVAPSNASTSAPRRSSRQASQSNAMPSKGKGKGKQADTVGWLAGLNVSMSLIATISQEIISLYCQWDRFSDDNGTESARGSVSSARKGKVVSMPMEIGEEDEEEDGRPRKVTSLSLTRLWVRMREGREADLSHPPNGKPVPVNKLLVRADLMS
jgi:cyclin C